jgi:hypothetical protein
MSFWALNDGSDVKDTGTTFETTGGDLEPIPNGTGCIAAIEEAKWDDYEGDRFISLKWRVARPAEFANRVVYQKVKVYGTSKDKDPQATSDKAKRMLAAIDANCGGKLSKVAGEPSDQDLMTALVGKMMAIKVMVWKMEIQGEEKSGNWVSAVAPSKGGQQAAPLPKPVPAPAATDDFDDDIPF